MDFKYEVWAYIQQRNNWTDHISDYISWTAYRSASSRAYIRQRNNWTDHIFVSISSAT
jgi:hypothetical protein